MKRAYAVGVSMTLLWAMAAGTTALAKSQWQKPVVMECALGPSGDCNVEAECPSEAPFVVAGGGGMPMAKPDDHKVGMTMNLPVSKGKWRVRWRNMSSGDEANIKVAVRIKCSDSEAEAGW